MSSIVIDRDGRRTLALVEFKRDDGVVEFLTGPEARAAILHSRLRKLVKPSIKELWPIGLLIGLLMLDHFVEMPDSWLYGGYWFLIGRMEGYGSMKSRLSRLLKELEKLKEKFPNHPLKSK